METVTPLQDQYWCRVDEFMESGDLNDLYPESLDLDNDLDIVNDSSAYLDSVNKSFDGFVANGIIGTFCLSCCTYFIQYAWYIP